MINDISVIIIIKEQGYKFEATLPQEQKFNDIITIFLQNQDIPISQKQNIDFFIQKDGNDIKDLSKTVKELGIIEGDEITILSKPKKNMKNNYENKLKFYDGIINYVKSNPIISILIISAIVIAFFVTLLGGLKNILPANEKKTIQGKVYNESNEPVKMALVEIIDYTGKKSYTDDLGTFTFDIKDEDLVKVEFRISHEEYRTKNLKDEIDFSITKKHQLKVILKKK